MFRPGAGAGVTASVVVDILNIVAVLKTDKDQKSAGAKKTLHPLLALFSTTLRSSDGGTCYTVLRPFPDTRPPRVIGKLGTCWQSRR